MNLPKLWASLPTPNRTGGRVKPMCAQALDLSLFNGSRQTMKTLDLRGTP